MPNLSIKKEKQKRKRLLQHEVCNTTTGHCRTETNDLPPYLGTNSGKYSALVLKIDMTSVIAR